MTVNNTLLANLFYKKRTYFTFFVNAACLLKNHFDFLNCYLPFKFCYFSDSFKAQAEIIEVLTYLLNQSRHALFRNVTIIQYSHVFAVLT